MDELIRKFETMQRLREDYDEARDNFNSSKAESNRDTSFLRGMTESFVYCSKPGDYYFIAIDEDDHTIASITPIPALDGRQVD